MNVLYTVFEIIGCFIIALILGLIGTIIFMFLFFNLLYVIRKVMSITSTSSSSTLNQSSTRVTKRNHNQNQVNYYKTAIHPFLDVCFKVKARKHTSRSIQKSEDDHNNSDKDGDYECVNCFIPKISYNPVNDKFHKRIIAKPELKERPNANKTFMKTTNFFPRFGEPISTYIYLSHLPHLACKVNYVGQSTIQVI